MYATTQNPAIIDPGVNAMIREFAAHRGFVGMPPHSNIYRSYEFPNTRQVWREALEPDVFALKLDHDADSNERLAKKFSELQNVSAHFAKYDKLGIATPVYLSPTGPSASPNFWTTRLRVNGFNLWKTIKPVVRCFAAQGCGCMR